MLRNEFALDVNRRALETCRWGLEAMIRQSSVGFMLVSNMKLLTMSFIFGVSTTGARAVVVLRASLLKGR